MPNLYPNIEIPGHGTWVAIGQKQTLKEQPICPDITEELKVGDIVRMKLADFRRFPYSFVVYAFKQEPENAPHSQAFNHSYDIVRDVVLTGIVTRVYKVPNRDTMKIPKDEDVLKHVSYHYGFEGDFNDGKNFCQLRINSSKIAQFICVYKWVADLKLP